MAYVGTGITSTILKTNGNGSGPTFQAGGGGGVTSMNVQVFTASGTYTPSPGVLFIEVECLGGGGSGGSTPNGGTGSGGSGGGYAKGIYTPAQIGASQTITIGQGGVAPPAGSQSATNGGDTSFGTLLIAAGGIGGAQQFPGSQGVVGTGGYINAVGNSAGSGQAIGGQNWFGGFGGGSLYGGGGSANVAYNNSVPGLNAVGYGAGGSGAANWTSGNVGGSGTAGLCIIKEYIG